MDKLAVTGDSILLQPAGFLWQGWDGKLALSGNNAITADGKSAILEPDVLRAAALATGKLYVAPPFTTPGSITSLQLSVVATTLSLSVNIQGQAVVTAATTGTYTAVVVPAVSPQGTPDPLLSKTGKWSVLTTSQVVFQSGAPSSASAAGGEADTGETQGERAENKPHWLGLTVEDDQGNPLSNQVISVLLPTGERVQRNLGASGSVRIDGIRAAGPCTANMTFDLERVPVVRPAKGFIAVEFVDEAMRPLAGREVKLTLPDGTVLQRALNQAGRARFEGIERGIQAKLDLVPEPEAEAPEVNAVAPDSAPAADEASDTPAADEE